MDILEKFFRIREWYAKHDEKIRAREGKPFYRTTHGLWGAAGMLDVFEFMMKAQGERFCFADYGSGDGRIVLVVALFTNATGIEGDDALTQVALQAREELVNEIPELERAVFKTGDYYEEDHAHYDLLFFFPDHPFPEEFQEKLKEVFRGYVIVYNKIHLPDKLTKGKTYWVQQVPLVSYPVGRPEEDLFFDLASALPK